MAKRKAKETAIVHKVKPIILLEDALRYYGPEPSWNDDEWNLANKSLIKSFNWYHYNMSEKMALASVEAFVTDKKDLQALRRLKPSEIPNRVSALSRMLLCGMKLNPAGEARHKALVQELVDLGHSKKEASQRPTVSVQSRAVQSAGRYIADLEDELDVLYRSNYKSEFKCYDWLSKAEVGPMVAKEIAAYYQPLLEELKLAVAKTDKDCTQGYATHSKAGMGRYIAFVQSIIDDCDKWSSNKRKQTVRKPRAKKTVTAAKQVDKLKYLKEDTDLKLASIDPSRIIGAAELWLYNTKNRMLQHYVAGQGGFAVKGTTLQNVDNSLSEMKKIRKPEIVSSFVDGGPKAITKQFNLLKVKPSKCNGRLNEFTLILRAIK